MVQLCMLIFDFIPITYQKKNYLYLFRSLKSFISHVPSAIVLYVTKTIWILELL